MGSGTDPINNPCSRDETEAVNRYRLALAIAGGDYLPDAIYQDWATPTRERLRLAFLGAATALATLLVARRAWVRASGQHRGRNAPCLRARIPSRR